MTPGADCAECQAAVPQVVAPAPALCGRAGSAARWLVRLPAEVLLLLLRIYQRLVSPALPAFFGPACGCRFTPTCSHYAADAIRSHGAIAGVVLTAIRLVKCTPLHPGGFDPVPARRIRRECRRAAE